MTNKDRQAYELLVVEKLKKYVEIHKIYKDAIDAFLIDNKDCDLSERTLYRYLSKSLNKSTTFKEHVENLNVNKNEIKSVKSWQTQKGENRYSVVFEPKKESDNWHKELEKLFIDKSPVILPKVFTENTKKKIAKVVTADWHIGAYIKNLVATQNFDLVLLKKYLLYVAEIINSHNYDEIHLSINGDLIESFSGMNHQGTFKELELWGKNAMLTAYEIIVWWLNQIKNVKTITLISGNHDRTQANRELEYEGEVAGILAYFLKEKLDCTVNYHPFVFSEIIDGISYINCHGDKKFINNPSDVAWKYGNQDYYNVIVAGHKHTRQRTEILTSKLTQAILGDAGKLRLIYCPSLFTGNFYSETLGFTSTAGFYIITNLNGLPYVHDIPLSYEFVNSLSL